MKSSPVWKILLILIVALLFGQRLGTGQAQSHPFFDNFERYPIIFAHQGSNLLWPGDTLYAFEHAAAMGVDVLEMDTRVTADGALVLSHAAKVDRATNGSGFIENMTLAEIQTLDAGYWWTDDNGQTYPYRGMGITIPTLESVFQRLPGYPLNIEIKHTRQSIAKPLCEMIRQYGMQDKVMVASSYTARIKEFREICPEVATSASVGESLKFSLSNYVFLGGSFSHGEFALQIPGQILGWLAARPSFVRGAHGRNLQVHVWTPNTREELQRFIEIGVDGIITDRPDILMELLGR